MKIVIKEWLRNKKSVAMILIWFALNIVNSVISARAVILISNTVTDLDNFESNIVKIIGLYAFSIICGICRSYLKPASMVSSFNTENNTFVDKILYADYDMFTKFSCAHINTVSEFCAEVSSIIRLIMTLMMNVIDIIIILWSMYIVGGNLVIPVIIIYVIGAGVMKILFSKYRPLEAAFTEVKSKRNQEIENIVNGFAEVRSYNTQDQHSGNVHGDNEFLYRNRIKKAKLNIITNTSIDVIDLAALLFVIIYAVGSIKAGSMSQAAAMSLVMYVSRIITPLEGMIDFVDELSAKLGLSESFGKIMNYEGHQTNGILEMDEFRDEIKFENVSFSYDSTSSVLDDINMSIKKGEKIGICGISGGGKSTMFKLLNRFYAPNKGKITIDGIDIKNITESSYRRFFGSVHQDNTIFPGSIWDNVIYGSPNATEYEVINACKQANVYNFISELPDGFDTIVGPRGLTLSGGQKQRIAIARMFLRNPKIVLLDEATSALDNESESIIKDAIEGLDADTTVITIAHRLTTIKNCDRIYVIGKHKIIESGSHDELINHHGEYYKMITAQEKNRD